MCERRRPEPDYLDDVLAWSKIAKLKETPCPLPQPRPAVLVYANPKNVPASERKCELEIVKIAATEAYKLLMRRTPSTSTKVVETALKCAGTLYQGLQKIKDPDKEIEADAAMLEDNYLNIGSVGAVKKFEHPISLAKYVMTNTDHVLIVSDGADYLAEELTKEDNDDNKSLYEGFKETLKQYSDYLNPKNCCGNLKNDSTFEQTEVNETEKEEKNEESVKELCVKKETVKEDHLKEEYVKEGCVKEESVKDDCVKEESVKDDCVKEESVKDDCVKEKSVKDDCVEEENEKEECLEDDIVYEQKTFGAVASNLERRRSCGVSVYRTDPEIFGHLSSAATVVGCGFYGNDDGGCVCVSGDDRVLYSQALARAIVEGQSDKISLKESMECQLDVVIEMTGNKTFGAVGIDAYGSPVVFFKAQSFPWAYCMNHSMFYGSAEGDIMCERVKIPEESLECCCDGEKSPQQVSDE